MLNKLVRKISFLTQRTLKNRAAVSLALMAGAMLISPIAVAQTTQTTVVETVSPAQVVKIIVVSHTTPAINYRHHGGSTKVDFAGTTLMPDARGRAEVRGVTGRVDVEAHFDHLRPATQFGPEYLTYVLWAITPEGRPSNLGELILNDDKKSGLKATTDLQSFGMIVTAEPYFAVTRPSNFVIMENVVRADTIGAEQPINAKFELLEKGSYAVPANAQVPVVYSDRRVPLDLYEARNAVAIARAAGADRYASDSFARAQSLLNQAEDYQMRHQGKNPIGTVARNAVQTAEDARVLAIQKRQEEMTNNQRMSLEQSARASAQAAEQARIERQAAEQAKAEADRARMQAEAATSTAMAQTQAAQAQAQAAQAEAQTARSAADQAIADREALRSRLLAQLNAILETRDTARGLIVNMPDVLFDTGKYTLKPLARERLAKVSGILLAYPGLKLEIEGHTDSVGSDEFNQGLSEKRAASVRDYLVSQSIPIDNTVARGLGKTQPIDSNDTAAGRQRNRRVELIVSGDSIGTKLGISQ